MIDFSYRIQPLGDSAITLVFGEIIDENVNQIILDLSQHFRSSIHNLWLDVVPAYSSLTLYYDPRLIWHFCASGETAYEYVSQILEKEMLIADVDSKSVSRQIRVPVCYSERYGPDLRSVARAKELEVNQVIEIHTSCTYKVYMMGFLPGFAYMGTLDTRLHMPRKDQPDLRIYPGSVGIAGLQTGIYPLESPGGWQIIGRTPVKLFDMNASPPVLFEPGDQVTFFPITEDEFKNY